MLEIIKKSFDKFDGLIIVAAVFLFLHFDYNNLSTIDKIYIASFVVWSVMKIVRIYITCNNERDKIKK